MSTYSAHIAYPTDDSTPCACGNCDWKGPLEDLGIIGGCSLNPGCPSPAGRCPACDSLAYLDRPEDRVWDERMSLLLLLEGGPTKLPDFLNWIADRLVHVHGENPNLDYILSLRDRAELARVILGRIHENG
jgi:hypothetical protein